MLLVVSVASGLTFAATAPLPELTQACHRPGQGARRRHGRTSIEQLIRTLQAATGDVVVVVTVASIEPYADIREYAVKLFENHGRGIGERGKDNGVLILLAMKEREVWIEVGYGLEQWITDGFAGETSRDVMAPEFRNGRYGAGLLNGTARVVARIAEGRNVTLTGLEPPVEGRGRNEIQIPLSVVILFFVAIVLLSRRVGGPGRTVRRWDRGGWSGWSSGVGPFGGWGGGGWSGGGGFGGAARRLWWIRRRPERRRRRRSALVTVGIYQSTMWN